jgi:hypothetical protein
MFLTEFDLTAVDVVEYVVELPDFLPIRSAYWTISHDNAIPHLTQRLENHRQRGFGTDVANINTDGAGQAPIVVS